MAIVTAGVDYVAGHLRYGHFEAIIDGEELEKFKEMSIKEQQEYLREVGELIIDDYRVNDYGDLHTPKINE